jgi:hypothetical protein
MIYQTDIHRGIAGFVQKSWWRIKWTCRIY